MSQDNLVKMECEGDETHPGKGHFIFSHKNKRKFKERLRLKKYCKLAKKHLWHKETK